MGAYDGYRQANIPLPKLQCAVSSRQSGPPQVRHVIWRLIVSGPASTRHDAAPRSPHCKRGIHQQSAGHGWQIRRRRGDGLDARLLVVGDDRCSGFPRDVCGMIVEDQLDRGVTFATGKRYLWRATRPRSTAIRTSCGRRGCWPAMRASSDRRQGTNVSPIWSRAALAALDDRPRPGKEPTITPEAKAWRHRPAPARRSA